MAVNFDAIEREEEDLCQRLSGGEISQKEFDDEMREINYSVAAAYDQDRFEALQHVDREWGIA